MPNPFGLGHRQRYRIRLVTLVNDDKCHSCGSLTTSTSDFKPYTVFCPNCGVLGIVTDSLVDPFDDGLLPSVTDSDWFLAVIQKRLPSADIRTDQCSTVRVYWRDVMGGIMPLETGGYLVSAGDALDPADEITFDMSHSSQCSSAWDAVHRLIEYGLAIVSKR